MITERCHGERKESGDGIHRHQLDMRFSLSDQAVDNGGQHVMCYDFEVPSEVQSNRIRNDYTLNPEVRSEYLRKEVKLDSKTA